MQENVKELVQLQINLVVLSCVYLVVGWGYQCTVYEIKQVLKLLAC